MSDIAMPGEDGCALVRRLRQRGHGRAVGIPALALSAFTRSEDRAQALAAGFQMHVAKPVDPAEVTAVIARLAATTASRA